MRHVLWCVIEAGTCSVAAFTREHAIHRRMDCMHCAGVYSNDAWNITRVV